MGHSPSPPSTDQPPALQPLFCAQPGRRQGWRRRRTDAQGPGHRSSSAGRWPAGDPVTLALPGSDLLLCPGPHRAAGGHRALTPLRAQNGFHRRGIRARETRQPRGTGRAAGASAARGAGRPGGAGGRAAGARGRPDPPPPSPVARSRRPSGGGGGLRAASGSAARWEGRPGQRLRPGGGRSAPGSPTAAGPLPPPTRPRCHGNRDVRQGGRKRGGWWQRRALRQVAARCFPARPACGAMAEEDWLGVEVAPSASEGEDEGQEDGERRHRRLLEAVSSLSGRKRRKLAERTEASVQVSEFNVSCKGAGEKLVLSELLQPIRPKSALSSVKNELTRVKQKKAVELPLSKEEAKRVVREAAYIRTSKDVGKWQQVVLQNRRAEQLVFPLKQEIATVVPLEQAASAWKARTPLEQEIFGLLHKTQQPITDPLLTPEETASLQAMSLEEARQRRAELQKARVIQSYYEAKARREKKIKSKKYHRVLKKSKRRKALKEFELLHKLDPEAALAKLEELEQLRMQERMSLKHQNKGKWARSRAIMAKYDLEARKAMQEQLAKNKELMQKVRVELPEEEPGDVPEEDLASVAVPTIPAGAGKTNPWMLGKPSGPAEEPEVQEGLGDFAVPGAAESKEEMEEEDEEVSEEEALLQDFAQKRHVRQQRAGSPEGQGADETDAVSELQRDSPVHPVCAEEQTSVGIEQPSQAQAEILLLEQLGRVQTMEDAEALASEEHVEELEKLGAAGAEEQVQQQEEGRAEERRVKKPPAKKKIISLQAVLSGKSQEVQCPSLPVVMEEEEGGIDQRGVITEAFAGDDVVADFRQEKHKAEQAAKPQPVNLVLPGWGEWGGTGLKPSTKKRKRFLLKPPPAPPRKDQHLPHVIMSERRNIHVAAHQVSELPFPFERHQQFEQSIRTPVGPTWNTQRAFQKLTTPRVITRAGHIIQPISAEDVPDMATEAGSGAKPALEIAPKQPEQPFRHPRRRAR